MWEIVHGSWVEIVVTLNSLCIHVRIHVLNAEFKKIVWRQEYERFLNLGLLLSIFLNFQSFDYIFVIIM